MCLQSDRSSNSQELCWGLGLMVVRVAVIDEVSSIEILKSSLKNL